MRTPTYRIEFNARVRLTNQVWYKSYGRPTNTNLAVFIATLVKSTTPGGTNDHLGHLHIATARIVRQATGEEVAFYHASSFEAIGLT